MSIILTLHRLIYESIELFLICFFQLDILILMFNRIRHRLMLQRWLNITIDSLYWASLLVGVTVILMHRLIGVSGLYVPVAFVGVPVVVWFWLQTVPIHDRLVIQYAESTTGQTGLLWFGSEVEDSEWHQKVNTQWLSVPIPRLSVPSDWKGMMLALCVALATLWIPIKTDKQFQPLVESEMTQLENTLEQLEALTVEEDASIEEWREQISALNQEDKVSSILRQSDYLQDQMNQRQSEMMDAIQEGMEALESGEEQSMTQAMKSLQDQGLIPKSAKDEQALASQAMESSQQGQSQDGEQDSTSSKEQDNQQQNGQSQNGQQQNGQQTGTQSQSSDDQGSQNQKDGQQSEQAQDLMSSAQQQKEQLQQQMSQIQERMQKMQQQQQSNGMQSMNNEQLKQMQQQMSQQSQQSQSGEGMSPGAQPGQSQAGGSKENGEPCELGTPNCMPSKGGETAPLTYGASNPLAVSDGNLASIEGVTEVDWNHNVYFGQGAGEFSGTTSSQINDGTVSGSTAESSFNNERIPPNQRGVVQRFFSTSSSNQGANDDNNTQP